MKSKMKLSPGDCILKIINAVFLLVFVLTIVFPFWNVFIKSFMTDKDIMFHPLSLWPQSFQFDGYKTVFTNKLYDFGRAFVNSVYITVVGTIYQLIVTTFTAYALSRRKLPGKKIFLVYFLFTMYFSGGMIPYYLIIKQLGLRDTREVMYLPAYMSMFNMLVMRSYFMGLPQDLESAAIIDGANRFQRIVYITIPSISYMIVTQLILSLGGLMNAGFDQIFYLMNPANRESVEIIDTYVHYITFQAIPDYGFSSAVGLFKTVINCILLLAANRCVKWIGGSGLLD